MSMHTGGYIAGAPHADDRLLSTWCTALDVVCVSIAYRLAPRTRYPGPLMDCYTALTWLHTHAEEHGIDPHRIGLHGTEAGGGLAAALALVARDHRDVPLAFQVLVRPMLDDRGSSHPGWASYLGDLYGSDDVPRYAAAGRCADVRRLPPAYVSAASGHDEGAAYAARLAAAGIPVHLDLDATDPADWLEQQLRTIPRQETA